MAGVKITDLEILTESASDDLLYIVDVSDTSQSPQGTSKQIEVSNVLAIVSGTWTPTITTDYQNAVLLSAFYTRIGNSVSFYINFGLVNSASPILFGDTYFTPPNGLLPSTNANGIMAFKTNNDVQNPLLSSYSITGTGTLIIFSMLNTATGGNYNINISGTYLIA
jgi:hypothetical protein